MGIQSFELEPSKENIINTIAKNLIDRNQSVWQFVRFCDAQGGKCSIALDAKWGFGKTFFVKQAKILLEFFNKFTNEISEEERRIVRAAFSQYIGSGDNAINIQPQVCVYYDAWSNDNDVDPVLSLIYEIVRTTACHYPIKKEIGWGEAATSIIDFFTGRNVKKCIESLRGEDLLLELKEQKDIHATIEEFLDSLLSERGNRLVVFIDELDRCKPSYAVQILERIKHYFSNDRITFVFSVNVDELQHTVKRYYGEGFDACRYLDRFFDYRMELPPANMVKYYREIGLDNGEWVFESVCKAVARHYGFGLREIEKFYRTAKIAAYKPTHNHHISSSSKEKGLQVSLFLFVPIMIGLRMVDVNLYHNFINGNNSNPLIEIASNEECLSEFCSMLLEQNEVYDEEHCSETQTVVRIEDKLNLVYNALFNKNVEYSGREIHVGKYSFSRQTGEEILRIVSMMSEYAKFE